MDPKILANDSFRQAKILRHFKVQCYVPYVAKSAPKILKILGKVWQYYVKLVKCSRNFPKCWQDQGPSTVCKQFLLQYLLLFLNRLNIYLFIQVITTTTFPSSCSFLFWKIWWLSYFWENFLTERILIK